MNSFGLGLVLDFTDNASARMTAASQTFSNLSATADQVSASLDGTAVELYAIANSMNQVGDMMTSAGSSILNVFSTVSQKVIDTGMEMQGFRMQMNALYGDSAGEKKIQEIKNYAATSVFEVEGLMKAVTIMKAVGIEAMDDVATSTGKTTQKLMDYASDLAAMMPNMRNVYGTGVNAAMGAFKEYIAEGNKVSLKRGAGLDIEQILGVKKGDTIEKRTQQVADLIEKLGIAGYTAQLYGTPMQQISNINDVIFNTLSDIADSGVFDSFCKLLSTASNFIQGLTKDEKKYAVITKLVADVVTALMEPLQRMLDFVIQNTDAILDWIEANPLLSKTIALVTVALGGFLVAGGMLLKVAAAVMMIAASFKYLNPGVKALTVISTGFKKLMSDILPAAAAIAAFYMAWKYNIFGVRDLVTSVFKQIRNVFTLTFDALSDNTLSKENFDLAQQLGLLPFIESMLDLKYHWGFLVDGFKKGIQGIASFFDKLNIKFYTFNGTVYGLFNALGRFFKQFMNVSEGSTDKWEKVGEVLGGIVTLLVGAFVLFKFFTVVAGIFGAIVKAVMIVVSVLKILWSVLSIVFSVVKIIVATVAAFFSIPMWLAGVIIAAVVLVTVLIIKYRDKIKSGFVSLLNFFKSIPGWLYEHILRPVGNFFITIINFIVGLVSTGWNFISGILSKVGTWISIHVITPVANFFKNLFTIAAGVISSVWNWLSSVWGAISGWVYAHVIQPVGNFFGGLFNSISNIVSNVWNWICGVWGKISGWVDMNVIQPVSNFFTGLATAIDNVFKTVHDSITGWFQSAYDFVTGLWKGIKDFFGGIFDSVSGWASKITEKGSQITGLKTVPAAATGVDNFAGGLLQVNEKGGELVNLPSGTSVIPHDRSIEESLKKGISIGAESLAAYVGNNKSSSTAQPKVEQNDYSVTFSAGSVVIQLANATDAELEKAADKLMKIIERKQQIKKMAQRGTKTATAVLV